MHVPNKTNDQFGKMPTTNLASRVVSAKPSWPLSRLVCPAVLGEIPGTLVEILQPPRCGAEPSSNRSSTQEAFVSHATHANVALTPSARKNRAAASQALRTMWRNPLIDTCYLHAVIDDNSRVAYVEARDDAAHETVAEVLGNAACWFAKRGVVVKRMPSDNGSC